MILEEHFVSKEIDQRDYHLQRHAGTGQMCCILFRLEAFSRCARQRWMDISTKDHPQAKLTKNKKGF